jgi:propanol-preferring alcohol dehydrogenase
MGYSIDGGFGEYAIAYGLYVVKVADGSDPLDAAPLTCAGVTTYKAVKVAGTRSSDLVAVFGVGGLGASGDPVRGDRRRARDRRRPD